MLRSYRDLPSLIRRPPPADQHAQALQQARQQKRSNAPETDALNISDMHKQLFGRVSCLRGDKEHTSKQQRNRPARLLPNSCPMLFVVQSGLASLIPAPKQSQAAGAQARGSEFWFQT